ncbi:hypothetical protein N658DRAFT_516062 [Parathielavia hyrcaniae]|uniref:ubiquitinyl hydrolase 1 n=1 Tax=Parathielavia hyrcaniae TaxID=113614 RepID=A0AAN6Q3R7_9PEZI|nr:hypothetical protein N658DRAFT_516062 [Parathielavia hyrcaniae]
MRQPDLQPWIPVFTPQVDDTNIFEEHNLIGTLLDSARHFATQCSTAEPQQLQPVIAMLERLLEVKPGLDSDTKASSMKRVIRELSDGNVALFHIRAQNAGLLLTFHGQDDILVESFELLARNGDVMSCKGRLVREFPDCAATVCRKTVLDPHFLDEFVDVLRCLELQASPQARPKSSKFGHEFDESRDTSSPLLISSMVLATLAGLGRSVTPRRVTKGSREQVNWDSTLLSWHRSPTWMLLRVAVRLVLDRNNSPSLYKALFAFHHARLLDQAVQLGLDSDLRFAMAAKLARRIMKLSPCGDPPWLRTARDVLNANQKSLQRRWQDEQARSTPVAIEPGRLEALSFKADTNLRLQELSRHLTWVSSRSIEIGQGTAGPGDKSVFSRFRADILPVLFHSYQNNPEALSLMYLVIMELYVALDKIAGNACPLLLDYNPGFGFSGFLDRLILSTRNQMVRLAAIEPYILDRRDRAPDRYPLAFEGLGLAKSFAVRYFKSSPEHQSLHDSIKAEAERSAAIKVQEYRTMRSTHAELRMACAYNCEACRLQSQISGLRISKFEWPLPTNRTLAQAIVFEIRVPDIVIVWRDVTADLFRDIFRDPGKLHGADRLWFARRHSGLCGHQPSTSKVQLASTVKPVEDSHYSSDHISAVTEAGVCACLEAGPHTKLDLVFRQAHADLSSPMFVRNLVAALNDSLRRYRENWQNDVAVSLLVCIATRLLAKRANCSTADGQEELTQRVLMVALTSLLHSPADLDALPAPGARWRRKEVVELRNAGFDDALQRFWADYSRAAAQWSSQPGAQAHILAAEMSREVGSPISITLNLLDGSLFVNGYPLTYTQLFGAQVLEVMPSRLLRFSACREQQGWIVHFAVRPALAAASSVGEDSAAEVCEFIPPWKLEGDVPSSFVRGYSHWLNLSTGAVEFRPVKRPWVSSTNNWTLTREGGRNILSRQGQGQYLIDPHSPTAEAISTYLGPIEATSNVDMIFQFSISFTLAEGESSIRSKHYSGMRIDECQNIGTLIGLRNKLVLKHEDVSEFCTPQRLAGHHVSVTVDQTSVLRIKHDAFSVDPTLGRIRSGGSLSSKFYLCYLHAVTAHCLADPVTGRTGTEEALRILQSASGRSFQRLDAESHDLLSIIAKLSPQRVFYPKHLQVMEQVKWSGRLPVLAQHDGFWPAVEAILSHARDCEIFHPDDDKRGVSAKFVPLERSSTLLVDRAKIRNAIKDHGEVSTRAQKATKAVASGHELLLERPSTRTNQSILEVTGNSFPGHPQVNLSFHLDYLQRPQACLAGLWCGLHGVLSAEGNKYKIAFFLSAVVHAENSNWDIVQVFVAFANFRSPFQTRITPPNEDRFDLAYKLSSMPQRAAKIVKEALHPFEQCPEATLPKKSDESDSAASQRRYRQWESESQKMVENLVSDLEAQWRQGRWTISEPITSRNYRRYLDVDSSIRKVREALELARRTSAFEEYLDNLVSELGTIATGSKAFRALTLEQQPSRARFVNSRTLFARPAPSTERPQPQDFSHFCTKVMEVAGDENSMDGFLDQLSRLDNQKPYQVAYVNELRSSSVNIAGSRLRLTEATSELGAALEENLARCKQATGKIRRIIDETLSGGSVAEEVAQGARLYPRISPVFLLQRLSRVLWRDLPADWRVCLVTYALSLVYLQRAERLINAVQRRDRRTDMLKELVNMDSHGCDKGDPLVFPENLLLELEQGILIRPVQQRIAAEMRDPPNGSNSVMQLNMGEGKSSVIVPIVSVALADGERLVRAVVAKAQSNQLMHTLIGTLGGLINRRVFYLPISRPLQLTGSDAIVISRMLEICRKEGGVLMVQPEHLASMKLMGLESTWADGEGAAGFSNQIVTTYNNMEDMSRDIVDESDENFSVKFELIYTMGTQRPIDMSPDRWTIIQELMGVVPEVAETMARGHEQEGVKGLLYEGDRRSGRFPTIRVLEESAGECLGFPIQHKSSIQRQAVLDYILQPKLSPTQIAAVQNASSGLFSEKTTKDTLLLLRGLLADNVILFALGKRFRVNYGLAPDRRPSTMLVVPYRAKDSPAPRSEFSHPDVVIVLTRLSYYYQGLSNEELRTCLEKLGKSEQADLEYSRWAAASPQLPSSLRHFSGVNVRDKTLCNQSIFPALRYAKPAVDFYLSTVVFPREMREFPYKLSASGWDLGKAKRHPLTGFSGTNDSKYVLPLSVTALDLPEQRHTNATVLACLLRPENAVLELGDDQNERSVMTAEMLLTAVTTSSQAMRVVLDVGAQIVELSNHEFAKRWLDSTPAGDVDAVIFFNDEELAACMRMRKLGSGQSVTFCVSPEMNKRVRRLAKLGDSDRLSVADVLVWSIVETWDDAHRSIPLWAAQGIRHQQQETVWERVAKDGKLSAQHVQDYLEDEPQSLEQRYLPESETSGSVKSQSLTSKLKAATDLTSRQNQVLQIQAKCVEAGLANLDAMGSLQEEQERELAPEVEREREVERPPRKEPASHKLHENVRRFALEGLLVHDSSKQSSAFMPAFQSLANTSAAALFPVSKFPSSLLVTADFARTLRYGSTGLDAYQRPVQWILTQSCPAAAHGMRMVIVSPYEAQHLKQLLSEKKLTSSGRDSGLVQLRAYLPRTSMSYPSMEDLTTYVFPDASDDDAHMQPPRPRPPPDLLLQLKLFSGGLYLKDFDEYLLLARYLGLSYTEHEGEGDVGADGFVGRAGGREYEGCEFASSPVGFLGVLFKRIRRDCLDIGMTHLGRLFSWQILSAARDFEGVGAVAGSAGLLAEGGGEEDREGRA